MIHGGFVNLKQNQTSNKAVTYVYVCICGCFSVCLPHLPCLSHC